MACPLLLLQEVAGGNAPLHYAASRSPEARNDDRPPHVLQLLLKKGAANADLQNAAGARELGHGLHAFLA